MLPKFQSYLQQNNLLNPQLKFLIAVSGGVDSTVLAHLAKSAGLNFSIAHCNFKLRGEESEWDEAFVKNLAKELEVEVFVQQYDTTTYAAEQKLSIQEAARNLRYQFFKELVEEHKFSYTLLAHHADDRIETLLMNFFRGTGLEGLTAMPEVNLLQAKTLRPLLQFRKSEIEVYAKEHQIKWREDASNKSNKYTRNYFRNELLPQLQKVYPNVQENLSNNIERFEKTNSLYKQLTEQLKQKLYEKSATEIRIPVLKLVAYKGTSLIYEIIKDFGFGEKQVDEVLKLLEAESGKYIENEMHQIIRHGKWLIIAPVTAEASVIAIAAGEKEVSFSGGKLQFKTINADKFKLDADASVAQLDAKELEYPLILRKAKEGDYFYPLGMRKKKKLSRFFIDNKLSKNTKENVWVLETNKKILWVIGHRIDDRFKIIPSTKKVMQISLSNL